MEAPARRGLNPLPTPGRKLPTMTTAKFALSAVDTVSRSNEGVDMPILTPGSGMVVLDPENVPMSLRLVGQDSEIYRRLTRAAIMERATKSSTTGISDTTVDEIQARSIDILVACTIGWNMWDTDGNRVPFSADGVRALYEGYPSIKDQADAFIVTRANFLPASPKK